MIETTKHPRKITTEETVYIDNLRQIYRMVATFDGFTKQYLVSDAGERAGILVVSGSYVLMVRQYRLLINDISLEIPGGKVDAGETPAETAIRECREETGVECNSAIQFFNYTPGLDVTKNPTYIFYSENIVQESIRRTEKAVWLPLDFCIDMIFQEKIQDAMTIIALFSYLTQRKRMWEMENFNDINPVCVRAGIIFDPLKQ